MGFPGSWVVKNLPANARDLSLIWEDPTWDGATKPMHHNYWACALEPTSHNYWAHLLKLLKLQSLEPRLHHHNDRAQAPPPQWEARTQLEPSTAKNNTFLKLLKKKKRKATKGTSLVVHTPNAGSPYSIPGQGTRSSMAQLKIPHASGRLNILCATTKTWCNQINIFKKERNN